MIYSFLQVSQNPLDQGHMNLLAISITKHMSSLLLQTSLQFVYKAYYQHA